MIQPTPGRHETRNTKQRIMQHLTQQTARFILISAVGC